MKSIGRACFTLVLLILFPLSCQQITDPIAKSTKRPLTDQEMALVSSDNRFGIKIFKQIAASQPDSNIFISPLSISMALGMTLNGALDETRQAMEQTLDLQGLSQQQINEAYLSLIELLTQLDPAVIFRIANSIWYRLGVDFKQPFLDVNCQYFKARIEGLDFNNPSSVSVINQWVNDQTNGRIKEVINLIKPEDLMLLINAIYFKGDWTYKFEKDFTQPANFYGSGGAISPCQLMHQENEFQYLETEDFQAVDLPYGIGDFRMAIFLPSPGKELQELIAGLSNEKLNRWLSSFASRPGILEFPKLKLEYQLELKKVLSLLGMSIAFNPDRANFRNIYEGPENAYISKAFHKTFVQIDEEGTEAAAVTVVILGTTSVGGSSGFYMRVDRPYFFVLHDTHSQTILFVGQIVQPHWND